MYRALNIVVREFASDERALYICSTVNILLAWIYWEHIFTIYEHVLHREYEICTIKKNLLDISKSRFSTDLYLVFLYWSFFVDQGAEFICFSEENVSPFTDSIVSWKTQTLLYEQDTLECTSKEVQSYYYIMLTFSICNVYTSLVLIYTAFSCWNKSYISWFLF